MVIIYGRRSFGRIEAHGGEHAQTSFVHVYYMPIVPISSFWVTQDLGTAVRGFEIRASGKSILAAYLRSWGPIAALIAFATAPGALGLLAPLPFVAATVWAWTLRSLRGGALRRSDFQLLAFGTRCDPERMPRDLRARVKASLEERWQKLDPGRPPDDVARFGPRSRDEAVIAFGLLRIAAVELGNADARAAAERILDGQRDAPTTADSPYRGDVVQPAEVLEDVTAAAATRTAAAAAAARELPAPRAPWWRYTGKKSVLVAFVVLAALGGMIEEGPSLLGTPRYGLAELMRHPDPHRYVEVRCDHVEWIGGFAGGTSAYACAIGDRVLPVAGDVDGTTVVGQLRRIDDESQYVWPRDVRWAPDTLGVFLEVKSPTGSRIAAVICLLVLAAAGVLGIRWLRSRKR